MTLNETDLAEERALRNQLKRSRLSSAIGWTAASLIGLVALPVTCTRLRNERDAAEAALTKQMTTASNETVPTATGLAPGALGNGAVLSNEDAVSRELGDALQPLLTENLIAVERGDEGRQVVQFTGVSFFDPGQATVTTDGRARLQRISEVLKNHPRVFTFVQGHADDDDATDAGFKDNWQLAGERARAVGAVLGEFGIVGNRMALVSYGESQPVADNGTSDGKAENRRVELALSVPAQEVAASDAQPATSQPGDMNAQPNSLQPTGVQPDAAQPVTPTDGTTGTAP